MINAESYEAINKELKEKNVTLVAVSKTKTVEDIRALYNLGQRDFGENYVQELVDKAAHLPDDIRWHFIGHLQGNKVKYIAPFVQLIHGVDSLKLLKEIDRQGAKFDRVIDCLLQVYIADEETKFGLQENEVEEVMQAGPFPNVRIRGLMAMASFTVVTDQVRSEFRKVKDISSKLESMGYNLPIVSLGMSSDYKIAIEEGSTMVRIGSLLFGTRQYTQKGL
ncbi:MAG TPA: YggS family pyridoxal phosphate-dependent enzyme [Chitinophagaceae bacterium]